VSLYGTQAKKRKQRRQITWSIFENGTCYFYTSTKI